MIVVVEEAGYLTVESEGTPPVFAVNGEQVIQAVRWEACIDGI